MKRQILALTSLRLFASVFIVVDHSTDQSQGWIRDLPFYQGVTFFFVLSGFILTYSYPSLLNRSAIKAFWVARFARVWPAYLVSLLLAVVLLPGDFGDAANLKGTFPLVLGILCLQSWVPLPQWYFAGNAVCWSISVEAFFYACFPWLVRDLDRTWPLKLGICASAVIAIIITIGMLHLPNYASTVTELDADALIYIFPLTRLVDFMTGMAAASMFRQYRWTRIEQAGTATILEAAIVVTIIAQCALGPTWYEGDSPVHRLFSNGAALWIERSGSAPLYALLIVVFAQEKGALSRALRGRFWVLGGEISFALYLLHQIWLRWMRSHAAIVDLVPHDLIWVLYTALIFVTSYAMWALIEKPCRNRITGWFRGRGRMAPQPTDAMPEDKLSALR